MANTQKKRTGKTASTTRQSTTKSKNKQTAKSSTARPQPRGKRARQTELEDVRRRQWTAIVLFAIAVMLMFIAILPIDSVLWSALHKGLLGLFGICAYLVPILLGYVAIATALDTEQRTIARRIGITAGLLLIVESLLEVFSANADGSYFEAIADSFKRGIALFGDGKINGGVTGALLGYPVEYLMSDVGAKILLILLLIVVVMLLTGTTLISLGKPFGKAFGFLKDRYRSTRDKLGEAFDEAEDEHSRRREAPSRDAQTAPRREEKSTARIDIDMGEGYSAPKKRDPKTAFETAAEEIQVESERPQLRIDDIIGRAIEARDAAAPTVVGNAPEVTAETVPTMTKEELSQEEAAVAQQIEAQEPVKESYTYPPLSLLKAPTVTDDRLAREEMQTNAELLVQTLKEFGISAKVIDISRGPSVTRYELQPNAGVKISRITGLADDIALRLATTGVRIEAPIPNKAAIGIEVPNKTRGSVCLRELIDSEDFAHQQSRLTVALGRDISGQVVTADLASMPHLLIAGTTGSGKSVCTNSMIQSILYHSSPEEVRMILIDPKQVEFSMYNGIPHLLVPVVTNPRKAAGALGWAVTEMINRYNTFTENNVRDIKSYNKLAKQSDTLQTMPLILIVIDELSDLMMAAGKEVEDAIVRLAQMARAAGMHLVIATQRPSVDVITGLIKANIPSRLALTVASAVDSRTILDAGGAEKLLGRGDMLFHPVGLPKPLRVQGCFVSDDEIADVVEFLKTSSASQYDEHVVEEINRQAEATEKPEAKDGGADDSDSDEMLPQAIEVVVEAGQASTSLLQRRLRVGYARAGRLIDEMEQRGIIGPHEGSKPRQVLISRQQWLEMQSNQPDTVGE